MLPVLADWCGIISFALTITLPIRPESMRKELLCKELDYFVACFERKERIT